MRIIRVALLILCLPILVSPLAAQISYLSTYDMTGGNPGGVNTDSDADIVGWSSILSPGLNSNVWSATQNIPFSFSFFGTPVTQFKVSANGLVTFDVGATALPSVNGDLVDPTLPNNTIACFWDEFTNSPPTGVNDEVYTRVYGTAGSQQLWIKWFSFEYGNPSDDDFNYFACVLEEGTGNVYMVDMGNSGNVANMSTTVGVQKDASLAAQFGTSTITFNTGSSSGVSNNTFYQFEPYLLDPFDLKADTLLSPAGDGCYSAMSDVSVQIVNLGTSDATGMTASYAIDGMTFIAPETIPGIIASGDTMVYTFTTQADLSAIASYDMVAVVNLMGDTIAVNDTASSIATSLSPIAVPFTENFDAGIPVNWTNDTTDEGEDWRNSITGDANTGPGPVDHTTGSGEYMWVDDSSPHSSETNFITPCIDLAGMNFPVLDFWLWSFNNNPSSQDMILHVDLQIGGIWINDALSPFGSQSAAWIPIQLSLAPYAGQTVRVRFRMEESGGGFEHDIAIDDVSVMEGVANDVSLVRLVSPAEADCGLTTIEPITIQVANFGANPATGITASFAVGSNPAVPAETIPGTLQSGDTLTYTFVATANFAALSTQSLDVQISFPGDLNSTNDSLNTTITTLGVFSAPYSENFDSGFPADWLNDPNDDGEEWLISTPSSNAGFGPDTVDHTTGSGKYLWVDDSGPHSAETGVITPCIDLTGMVLPELEFWVWSNNEDPTEDDTKLHVDIHSNGVWTQNVIPPIVDMDSIWEQVLIDISAFSGEVIKVRFRMEEFDTGFKHDIAIDDFRIFEELTDDVTLTTILAPSGVSCGFSSTETISIEVENLGTNPLTGIMASFQINGGTVSPVETIPGTLAPGATMAYTFIATADLSMTGQYTISAVANTSADLNSLNDSLEVTIEHLTATVPPLFSNLESYPAGSTQFSNLYNDATAQVPWQINTGLTPTSNTGPVDDVSIGGNYLYMESSGTSSGDQGIICFDCVDLTGFTSPELTFSYHLYGSSVGSFSVDINSGGTSTNELLLVGQQQISSLDPWITQTIDLSAYTGQVIQVCFTGEILADSMGDVFKGDMAIDGLEITQIFSTDVGATGIEIAAEPCMFTDAEPITVHVANSSQTDVNNIIMSYALNGGAFSAPEIFAGPISAGDTVSYTFTATADLSAQGSYDIVAAAIVNGDENSTNDTTEFTVANDASSPIAGFTSSVVMNTVTFTNASSGGGNLTYTWDFGDGSPLNNDENPIYTYASPGGYSVLLIISNECGSTSIRDSVFIEDPTMGLDEAFASQIQVFPNPTTGNFEVRFGQTQLRDVEIAVYSIQGHQVYYRKHSTISGPGLIPVQLSGDLTAGMYLLELRSAQGTAHQRLMLRK